MSISASFNTRMGVEALGDSRDDFATAVIEGLSKPRKTLPCQFFYDAQGSALFELITELPEYYPTRVETAILAENARAMMTGIGSDGVLVELGSGSSRKTELMLDVLPVGVAYVPVDVSPSALEAARRRLCARYPHLDVRPVLGSFTEAVRIPADLEARPRTGFFPGSTIGNFTPPQTVALLRGLRQQLLAGGRMIVGVDLKKDPRRLIEAYNDASGITAAFNVNLLARINRELGSAIDVSTFRHKAIYDARQGCIEMHLVSLKEQTLQICGRRFHFDAGETIHTESSYKYSVTEFQNLARLAGWTAGRVWVDADGDFSLHELVAGKEGS